MKKKNKIKKLKKRLALEAIEKLFSLRENKELEEFQRKYNRLILKIAKSFNIRLCKEKKLLFCKKCFVSWPKNCKIILNKKNHCIEYICKECGFIKRIRYK